MRAREKPKVSFILILPTAKEFEIRVIFCGVPFSFIADSQIIIFSNTAI